MKKFSKILAVLLAVVLLLGMTVTMVSADSSAPTGAFTDSSKNTGFEDGTAFEIKPAAKGQDTGDMISELVNTGSNTYNRYSFNAVGPNGEALNSLDKFALPAFYVHNLLSYDYLTLDFDIVADKYTDGKNLITIEEYEALSDAEKEAYYPSYVESWIYYEFKQITNNYNKKAISFSRIDGDWYIISNDGDKENRYPLPDKAGVWTHITQVVEISNITTYTNGDSVSTCSFRDFIRMVDAKTVSPDSLISVSVSQSRSHVYVDGEYAFEFKNWPATNKDNEPYATYIDNNSNDSGKAFSIKWGQICGGHDQSTKITKSFSMGMDNIGLRTYHDYTGDLHKAVKSRDALFNCSDTVINAFYQYPEGTPYRAKLTTEDKQESYYYLPAGAIASATPNSEIEIFTNCVAPIKPTTQFAIKHNGYSISVDPSTGYLLSEHADADKYSVRRALYSDYADVVWDYEGDLYDVTRTLSGSVPEYIGDTTVVNGFDARTNVYTRFLGWSTDPNATAPSALPTLSAGDELYVYPVYDRFEAKYLIYAPDGSLAQINGSYECYKDINTIGIAISNAPTDSKVILLSDVDMAKASAINITKAVSVEIDLNGYSLYYGFVGVNVPTYMATLASNGAKLTIYSSKPGSKILAYSANAAGVMNDAACLFNVTAGASVILGNGTDDLLVSANTLLYGNVSTGKASLTINGGTYVSEASAFSTALVSVKGDANFDMNINDAYLSAKNILFKAEGNIVVTASVVDSTIIRSSSGVIGYIVGTTNTSSTYTFKNSTLIGKLFLDGGKGTAILDEGTKITGNIDVKGYDVILADGVEIQNVSEDVTVTYTSFDYVCSNKVISYTEATRTASGKVIVSVVKPGEEGAETPEPITPPANEEEELDADTPIIPAPKSIVYESKTMTVHDAPVSITLGTTENNEVASDLLPIINLTKVEAIPTKEENE